MRYLTLAEALTIAEAVTGLDVLTLAGSRTERMVGSVADDDDRAVGQSEAT